MIVELIKIFAFTSFIGFIVVLLYDTIEKKIKMRKKQKQRAERIYFSSKEDYYN